MDTLALACVEGVLETRVNRVLIGLLAAVGTLASTVTGLVHGDLIGLAIGSATAAGGLVAFASASQKKVRNVRFGLYIRSSHPFPSGPR